MTCAPDSAEAFLAGKNRTPSLGWNIAKFMMGFVGVPVVFIAWDAWHTVKTANLKIQAVKDHPQNISRAAVEKGVRVIGACPVNMAVNTPIVTTDVFQKYEVVGTIRIIAHQLASGEGWANYSVIVDGKSAGDVSVTCPLSDQHSMKKLSRGEVASPLRRLSF